MSTDIHNIRPLVYVAGPYTQGDTEENVKIAMETGNRLFDASLAPVVPHLSHFWDADTPRHYEEWMALDFSLVSIVSCVLRLPGYSPGADREVALANHLGISVAYSVEECIEWLK